MYIVPTATGRWELTEDTNSGPESDLAAGRSISVESAPTASLPETDVLKSAHQSTMEALCDTASVTQEASISQPVS